MKELDLLKKDWKKTATNFEQVSEKEIYAMLHKNSSSVVKWILIISILEVSLWTVLGFSFNADEYFSKLHRPEVVLLIKGLTYLNYFVVLIFIYLFYKNYQKISAISSTKKLMKDILKTRNTVQYYVWYNLGMIVFSLIIGIMIAFTYNPEMVELRDKLTMNPKALSITILLVLVVILVFFVAFWAFYRLLYGFLLRRLLTNYNELKKIDF